MASPRRPAVDARCAEYVALLEQGHALAEIAEKFGVARNAVEEVLRRRGLPHTMKAAVRAMHARNAPRRDGVHSVSTEKAAA